MSKSKFLPVLICGGLLSFFPLDAHGQLGLRRPSSSVRSYILNRPSVSPYLSLLNRDDLSVGLPTYHTRVRPQIEAEQRAKEQAQQTEQIRQLQSRVSSVRRDLTSAQNNNAVFPTGHPTRFRNYSHYYPALFRR